MSLNLILKLQPLVWEIQTTEAWDEWHTINDLPEGAADEKSTL